MEGFIIISVAFSLGLCYAYPSSQGVGAYAYQDSAGNRYGGTYDLGPDSFPAESNFINPFNNFEDVDFFPAYFKNFQKFMEQTFGSNMANQIPYAGKRAYGLTPHRVPQFSPFFRLPNYGGFDSVDAFQPKFGTPNFGPSFASNSAFAGAVAGPAGVHQVAAINPPGSNTQNIDINRASQQPQGNSNFYGVSSSSFASSANVNGKVTGTRRAETVVNENGKITKYKVEE